MNATAHTLTTNASVAALNLSFYSLSKLSDALCCVNPATAFDSRIARLPGHVGVLKLDELGNYLSFSFETVEHCGA